jgi:hypothetical protein
MAGIGHPDQMEPTTEFAPLRGGHRRPRLFRTVQLNAAGWAAVATAMLLAGLVLAIAAIGLGRPAWVGAVLGALVVPVVLVVLDRRRYRRAYVSFGWTDDESVVVAAAGELALRGITATVVADPPGLRLRRRDERFVREMLGRPPR